MSVRPAGASTHSLNMYMKNDFAGWGQKESPFVL